MQEQVRRLWKHTTLSSLSEGLTLPEDVLSVFSACRQLRQAAVGGLPQPLPLHRPRAVSGSSLLTSLALPCKVSPPPPPDPSLLSRRAYLHAACQCTVTFCLTRSTSNKYFFLHNIVHMLMSEFVIAIDLEQPVRSHGRNTVRQSHLFHECMATSCWCCRTLAATPAWTAPPAPLPPPFASRPSELQQPGEHSAASVCPNSQCSASAQLFLNTERVCWCNSSSRRTGRVSPRCLASPADAANLCGGLLGGADAVARRTLRRHTSRPPPHPCHGRGRVGLPAVQAPALVASLVAVKDATAVD